MNRWNVFLVLPFLAVIFAVTCFKVHSFPTHAEVDSLLVSNWFDPKVRVVEPEHSICDVIAALDVLNEEDFYFYEWLSFWSDLILLSWLEVYRFISFPLHAIALSFEEPVVDFNEYLEVLYEDDFVVGDTGPWALITEETLFGEEGLVSWVFKIISLEKSFFLNFQGRRCWLKSTRLGLHLSKRRLKKIWDLVMVGGKLLGLFLAGSGVKPVAFVPVYQEDLWTWSWENFIPYLVVSYFLGFYRVSVLHWLFRKSKPKVLPPLDGDCLSTVELMLDGDLHMLKEDDSLQTTCSLEVLNDLERAKSLLNTIKLQPCVDRWEDVCGLLEDFVRFGRPSACSCKFLPSWRFEVCLHCYDLGVSPSSCWAWVDSLANSSDLFSYYYPSGPHELTFLCWFCKKFNWLARVFLCYGSEPLCGGYDLFYTYSLVQAFNYSLCLNWLPWGSLSSDTIKLPLVGRRKNGFVPRNLFLR
jgi:hypothetical protein